ncbi:SlyX family protein [uncultured Devosia sp.]|uniref:SlyX family protein n=1 Tax=uncultured Devosia sp. TaxID=211434 RepID=UPI0035CAC0E5
MSTPADRLDALETRIAYQDETIEELNATITAQWAVIDALSRKVNLLDEQARAVSIIADPSTEPPPPHY